MRKDAKEYTLAELRYLAPGFPVYTLSFGNEYGWALLDCKDGKLIAIRCLAEDGVTAEYLHEDGYGTIWTAYNKDISPWEHD